MKKSIIGVYKIFNTLCPNEKYYIGYSHDVMKRWNQHKYDLKMKRHCNSYLQNSYNKYGSDCFTYEILHECENEYEAQKYELSYLKDVNIRKKLYNLTFSNDDDIMYHSEDTLIKMKQSHKNSYKKGRIIANKRNIIINDISYPSINEASRQLEMSPSNIKYRLKSTKYINYEYADNINEISEETRTKLQNSSKGYLPKPHNFRSIVINNIVYKSVSEAARQINVHRTSIYDRLKSSNPKFANYKYVDI